MSASLLVAFLSLLAIVTLTDAKVRKETENVSEEDSRKKKKELKEMREPFLNLKALFYSLVAKWRCT
jgi:hypothetical protein